MACSCCIHHIVAMFCTLFTEVTYCEVTHCYVFWEVWMVVDITVGNGMKHMEVV